MKVLVIWIPAIHVIELAAKMDLDGLQVLHPGESGSSDRKFCAVSRLMLR